MGIYGYRWTIDGFQWKYHGKIMIFLNFPLTISMFPIRSVSFAPNCQTACKPGSVPICMGDDHSSATPVTRRLVRPTRMAARKHACRAKRRHPYLVLLPMGFAVPLLLPAARCALTAPFHPYHPKPELRMAVCFLWHFPWGRPRRALPGIVFSWSPDFPPPHNGSGHPAI